MASMLCECRTPQVRGSPHGDANPAPERTPSSSAARCQGPTVSRRRGAGAVSARNCSTAAIAAAASGGEAAASISIRGRAGRRLPFVAIGRVPYSRAGIDADHADASVAAVSTGARSDDDQS